MTRLSAATYMLIVQRSYAVDGEHEPERRCWDNSVVESFFGKLKSERLHWRSYHTRSEARADVVEYITMRHNSLRLHSYLDYLSPDEFERRGQLAKAA